MSGQGPVQVGSITDEARRLAEQFLDGARGEIVDLAQADLEVLRAAANELRAAASDRSKGGRSADQVAFTLVASAFNQALASRGDADPVPGGND